MEPIRALRFCAALCLAIGLLGCGPREISRYFQCKSLFGRYLSLPDRDNTTVFSEADLETQYAVYMCGMTQAHPPITQLVTAFAREGPPAAEFLQAKLRAEPTDYEVARIVEVLTEMHRLETYNTMSDKELMRDIDARIAAMRDPGWRGFAEDGIGYMRATEARRSAAQPVP